MPFCRNEEPQESLKDAFSHRETKIVFIARDFVPMASDAVPIASDAGTMLEYLL